MRRQPQRSVKSSIGDISNVGGQEWLGVLNGHPRGAHLQLVDRARARRRARSEDARVADALVRADDVQAGEVVFRYGERREIFGFDAIVDAD